jgi:hypothetical protein
MDQRVHRRIARETDGRPWLWIITRDDADYHVCVWQLEREDLPLVTDWERQARLRQSHGLSKLAAPDDRLSNPVPRTLTVRNLDDARTLLSRDEPALTWHVDEFFHSIDAERYPPGREVRRNR